MSKKDKRREEIQKFILSKSFTVNVTDIARIFSISKPTAATDLDFLLSAGKIPKNKVRRNWNIFDVIKEK